MSHLKTRHDHDQYYTVHSSNCPVIPTIRLIGFATVNHRQVHANRLAARQRTAQCMEYHLAPEVEALQDLPPHVIRERQRATACGR